MSHISTRLAIEEAFAASIGERTPRRIVRRRPSTSSTDAGRRATPPPPSRTQVRRVPIPDPSTRSRDRDA